MANQTAERLERNIDKILTLWEERVTNEVQAAHHQKKLALRNSLPQYLALLVDALSNTIDRTNDRIDRDKIKSTKIGKKHGEDRAGSKNYTIDQLITEYQVLRQVLCDVMENESPLSVVEREVIVCSIEQAVNDAATEYSDTLKGLKEKISSTLTHDLRGPLTSTKISAQLVMKKFSDDEYISSKMKQISNNMDRLDLMISGLLDASRLEAGEGMPVDIQMVDLDLVLRQVTDELSLSYPDYFKMRTPGECKGHWDENGLRRIIENLLTNAIKYGEINRPITITLGDDDDSVELSVHNYGKVITKEEIPILFEQYKRLKSANDKSGWGLGLTMVKGMVEALHGSIIVESENLRGTTFKIKLPKDAREKSEATEEPARHSAKRDAPQVPRER